MMILTEEPAIPAIVVAGRFLVVPESVGGAGPIRRDRLEAK